MKDSLYFLNDLDLSNNENEGLYRFFIQKYKEHFTFIVRHKKHKQQNILNKTWQTLPEHQEL